MITKTMKSLQFAEGVFDCVLCLNGVLPDKSELLLLKDVPFIAADGASLQLAEYDIPIRFIIGDFDSAGIENLQSAFPESTVLHTPDQELNDFEKSLLFCLNNGYTTILICGFHGKELDHTFNNWSVFIKYSQQLFLTIYDYGKYALSIKESTMLTTFAGERVSFIPQPFCRLTLQGFRWNLNNDILSLGVREGARNIAESTVCTVDIHEGQVLCFLENRFPLVPFYHTELEY